VSRRPFISYAREDQPAAVRLYAELKAIGVDPWLDLAELLPGHEWQPAIRQAIREASHIIVLISANSVQKTGFVQNEIREAIDLADSRPPGAIFVIPARLDETTPKYERLLRLQWVDMFPDYDAGFRRLAAALGVDSPIARVRLRSNSKGEVFASKRFRSLQRLAATIRRSSYWWWHSVALNDLLAESAELKRKLVDAGVSIGATFGSAHASPPPVHKVVTIGPGVAMTAIRHVIEILPADSGWYIHTSDDRGVSERIAIGAYGYGGEPVALLTRELKAAFEQPRFTANALRVWIASEGTVLNADYPQPNGD
jgi:hypothetical protein